MALHASLSPQAIHNRMERDQTGAATATAEQRVAIWREEVRKVGEALKLRRISLQRAIDRNDPKMKSQAEREIREYAATHARMAAGLAVAMEAAELEKAQRMIDGTCNSQDAITADDVLAKYDEADGVTK